MRIFVTGGAGYIGSHIIAELLSGGFDVFSVDDFSNSRPSVYATLERLSGRTFETEDLDLRDGRRLRRAMSAFRPDAVIHLAGLKSVEESVSDPLRYYDCNLVGTIRLMEAMAEASATRIVFSSTAAVYGTARYLPLDEDHPVRPQSPYGRTKLMLEDMLRDTAAATRGFSVAVLRYFNPVGAHDSGLLGEQPGRPRNLMPVVAMAAAGLTPEVVVHGTDYDTPDGSGVRDYLHVVDLARAHVRALDWTRENAGLRVFNLGTGRGTSVLELIRTFAETNAVAVPFRIAGQRAGDVAINYADAARAEAELGWRAERGLPEMCASVWAWQKRQTGAGGRPPEAAPAWGSGKV